MGEQFDCGICYLIMHQAVTLMPCLHSYCGGCFSDWLQRSKECPNCRESVIEVKKNSLINSLIENYLSLNEHLRREAADMEMCTKRNIFTADTVSTCILYDYMFI
jgi:E3 ubiquitin-protein ligase CHFR